MLELRIFPGRRGGRRPPGKNFHTIRTVLDRNGKRRPMSVDVVHEHLEAAGIVAAPPHDGRPVRWHDQRHTCASHLIAGWRGQTPWRLEVIRDLLGHSSIAVTERYAHPAASVVREAAEQTRATVVGGGEGGREGHARTPVELRPKPRARFAVALVLPTLRAGGTS